MINRPRKAGFRPLALAAAGLSLAACSGPYSALDPAGPAAEAIAQLWWIMLIGAVALFFATSLVLAGAFVPAVRTALSPQLLIGAGGLAIPSLVLAALVVAAFALGERLLPHRGTPPPLRIEAEANQFAWAFRYPALGAATVNELHIPAGVEIEFVVTSADVIHSFWVPALGGKIDAIPGHPNRLRLRADRPGTYGGLCAEFCGAGHANMNFTVIAHAPETYDAALAEATEAVR